MISFFRKKIEIPTSLSALEKNMKALNGFLGAFGSLFFFGFFFLTPSSSPSFVLVLFLLAVSLGNAEGSFSGSFLANFYIGSNTSELLNVDT